MRIVSRILEKLPEIFVPFALFSGKLFLSQRSQTVLKWKLSHGDETLCIDYPLKKSSVVFDIGGYLGDWSADMNKKYNCRFYIFEPVKEYVNELEIRFSNFKNIHIFPYGLSGKTNSIYLHMSKNATSEFGKSKDLVKAKLVNVKNFIEKHNIKRVDLVSINIEGGEYELLEYLLKEKLVKRFKNIQVQFHPFVPNAKIRAKAIQKELDKTHTLRYQYPFVWESWSLRKSME